MFLHSIGISTTDKHAISTLAKKSGIPVKRLQQYETLGTIPSSHDLKAIAGALETSVDELQLRLGIMDRRLIHAIRANASHVFQAIQGNLVEIEQVSTQTFEPVFVTEFGRLYQADCIPFMKTMEDESVDLVFADPPFNLSKLYPSEIDDNLKADAYIEWCESWLKECIRLLKPGGSLFVWNIPKWNIHLSNYLNQALTFRHWISVDVKYSLPISSRLYPSHYSLLYYCKGEKPNTFHPDRLPMDVCPHCVRELKDYGGYKDKMNPLGISLTDVWLDIPPVRHHKYKNRKDANELSLRLMDRVVEMASNEGDVVFDPFGGAGTTYAAAELKKRNWIGVEIGPPEDIILRLNDINIERTYLENIRSSLNNLFLPEVESARRKKGLWTCGHIPSRKAKRNPETTPAPVDNTNTPTLLGFENV